MELVPYSRTRELRMGEHCLLTSFLSSSPNYLGPFPILGLAGPSLFARTSYAGCYLAECTKVTRGMLPEHEQGETASCFRL